MRSDNGRVIVLSKRVADRAVAIPACFLLILEAFLFPALENLIGTGISLVVVMLLALVVVGLLLKLHRQITSGRLVYQGGAWLSGNVFFVSGLAYLLPGPQRIFSFVDWPFDWIIWVLFISFWFVVSSLAFRLEAAIAKEAHRSKEDSDKGADGLSNLCSLRSARFRLR